jgi:hypothetical protein
VRNSVKKWCGFRVVLMKSGGKKWKSEKKLQKVNEYFFDRIDRINRIKRHILVWYFVVFGGKISGRNARRCTVARVVD